MQATGRRQNQGAQRTQIPTSVLWGLGPPLQKLLDRDIQIDSRLLRIRSLLGRCGCAKCHSWVGQVAGRVLVPFQL